MSVLALLYRVSSFIVLYALSNVAIGCKAVKPPSSFQEYSVWLVAPDLRVPAEPSVPLTPLVLQQAAVRLFYFLEPDQANNRLISFCREEKEAGIFDVIVVRVSAEPIIDGPSYEFAFGKTDGLLRTIVLIQGP